MEKELNFNSIKEATGSLKKHEIKEWGGFVYIGLLNVEDWVEFASASQQGNPTNGAIGVAQKNLMYGLIKACVRDSTGAPLFNDETIWVLDKKDFSLVSSLFEACAKINNLKHEEQTEIKKK